MNRRIAAVLVGTLTALVVATLIVPVIPLQTARGPTGESVPMRGLDRLDDVRWVPLWEHQEWWPEFAEAELGGIDYRILSSELRFTEELYWPVYALQIASVAVLGGILALALRMRAVRRAAEA